MRLPEVLRPRAVEPLDPATAEAWRRAGPWRPRAALAAVVVLSGVWLVNAAVRMHTFQPDEYHYISQARDLLSHSFTETMANSVIFDQGLQRAVPLLQALIILVSPSTPTAFVLGHAVFALLYVSAAIPAFLIARDAGAPPWGAVLAAAMVLGIPWAASATTLLTEPVAYPAFAWAVWAIARSVHRAGIVNDVLALALIGVATVCRANLIVLGLPLVLGAIIQDVRFAGAGTFWRRLALVPLRRVALVVVLLIGAVMILAAPNGAQSYTGSYPGAASYDLSVLGATFREEIAHLAEGLAIVPMALGIGWALWQLLRPASRRAHAFALTALLAGIAVPYSTSSTFHDERYVMYVAIPLLVAAAVAIAARQVPVLLSAGAALGLVLCIDATPLLGNRGAYEYFFAPGETFYANRILGSLSDGLPGVLGDHRQFVALVAGVALTLIAGLIVQRTGLALRGLVVVAVVAVPLAAGISSVHRFLQGTGEPHGASWAARAFADENTREGERIAVVDVGKAPSYHGIYDLLRFYNRRAQAVLTFPDEETAYFIGGRFPLITVVPDKRTGSVEMAPSNYGPEAILSLPQFHRYGLAGRVIHISTNWLPLPVTLTRVAKPLHLAWMVSTAVDSDGWVPAGRDITIRVYAGGLAGNGPKCLALALVGAPIGPASHRYVATGGSSVVRGTVERGATAPVVVQLAPFGGRANATIDLRVAGGGRPNAQDHRRAPAQLLVQSAGACAASQPSTTS